MKFKLVAVPFWVGFGSASPQHYNNAVVSRNTLRKDFYHPFRHSQLAPAGFGVLANRSVWYRYPERVCQHSSIQEKFKCSVRIVFITFIHAFILLFEIRIRVLEGRQLPGSNIHPVVRVTVAGQQRETTVKRSTNKPVYNQVRAHDSLKDIIKVTLN